MTSPIPIPSDRPVRVRIAPSPTGDPHVGTAYIGLFNLAFARKHGGKFVLRIEDTDQVRSSRESEQAIFDSLRWVGLEWDEGPDIGGPYGPYRQSERTALYKKHAEILIENGNAYRCFATSEELSEMRRVAREEKRQRSYDGRYRDIDAAEIKRRMDADEPYVVRLKMPREGETVFQDGLRGEVSIANAQVEDQVLLKSDGFPTYHLANIVDDHLMEITHVVRAEEWISSTPKHVQLYKAFGWDAPVFIHMPLLRNPDKSKISKRKNPVSLEYYERAGILPEALLNYLGRMGWSMPDEREKFALSEMIAEFDLSRVRLGGPVFDMEKLDWLNGLYIHEMDDETLVTRLMDWRLNREFLTEIAPLIRTRITRLDEFVPMTAYFFGDDFTLDATLVVPKKREPAETRKALIATVEALDGVRTWDGETIEATMRAQCEALDWKVRDLFMAIRVSVTGRKATPGLYETMEVLGKARCQARIRAACVALKRLK